MDFEEMQVIWNKQNNEKLYAINEEGLHSYIRKKGRSITRSLSFVDWMMMIVNVGLGIFLFFDMGDNNNGFWQFLLPGLYVAYGLGAFVLRLLRREKQKAFPETMAGDLDRSIWEIDYLIRMTYRMYLYYLLPLCFVGSIYLVSKEEYAMAAFMVITLPIACYFGVRWENGRYHQPRKDELITLRDKLDAAE